MTTSVAVKPPCRVQTTAAITLSGEQTVNGVAVVTGDRVLVKDQASSIDNGIYIADTSAWARAPDFDGSLDAVDGTLVLVHAASGPDQLYELSATNPVIIGTSALTFTLSSITTTAFGASLIAAANAAAARALLGSSTVGDAVFIAVDGATARTALGAAASGPIGSSGITGAAVAGPLGASGITGAAESGANNTITSVGAITGVTAALNDSSTKLATTAFVAQQQGLTLIETKTAAASASLEFVTGIGSTYDEYLLIFTDIRPATDAANWLLQVSQDAGGTWKSGATDYAWTRVAGADNTGTAAQSGSTGSTSITLLLGLSNASTAPCSGEVRFWNPAGTTKNKLFASQGVLAPSGLTLVTASHGGLFKLNQAAINGVRLLMNTGNITSGTVSLYGVRK